MPVIPLLMQLLVMVPSLIQAGVDVSDIISDMRKHLENGTEPSSAEWAALEARVQALQADLATDPA